MDPAGTTLFVEMARYAPLRTAIFSLGPPVWGLLLVANAYVNGGALHVVIGFAALVTTFSILLTRYHAATFRRTVLAERWLQ